MSQEVNNRLKIWINAIPRAAGLVASLAGIVVLIGWMLDIPVLKSLLPNLVSMKANTALAFVFAGMALLLHSGQETGSQLMIARFLACLAGLIGLVTVIEYAFNLDAGIDQLLFKEPQGTIGTYSPGRMALNAAINFCLLGLALAASRARTRWGEALAQLGAIVIGMFGLLVVLAYVYGLSGFTGFAVYTRMALHTAASFVILSIGVLCLRPDVGLMAVLLGEGSSGYMARRLMFAAVGVPIVLGWLVVMGEMSGLYGDKFGDVIAATAYVAVFMFLIWMIGRSLNTLEGERRTLEQTVRQSEREFKDLFDDAPVAYHEFNDEGRLTRVNQTELGMLGYQAGEMLGHFVWEFLYDQAASRQSVLAKLAGTKPPAMAFERLYRRKDLTTLPVVSEDKLLRDSDGRITGIRTTIQDITDLKRTEQALNDSREALSRLLNSLAEGTYGVDSNGNCTFVNRAFLQMLGYQNEHELLGKHIHEIIHHSYCDGSPYPSSECRMYRAHQTNQLVNVSDEVFWRKDGVAIPVEYWSHPVAKDGVVIGSIATFVDITERKRAEEALAAERSLLRTLIDNVPDAIYVKDAVCRKTLANPVDVRNMGAFTEAEALGKTDFDFYPREIADAFYADDQSIIQSGRPVLNREEMITLPGGAIGWQLTSKVPLRDGAGQVIGLVGIGHDITQRKRAEDALRESEEQFHSLFHNMDEGVALHELVFEGGKPVNYRIVDVNDGFVKTIGMSREQVVGKLATEAYGTPTPPYFEEYVEVSVSKQRIFFETFFSSMEKHFAISVVPWRESGFATIFADITERKKAEREIRLLAHTLSSTKDCVSVGDLEDKIVFVNNAFLQTYGYTREELLGHDISIIRSTRTSPEIGSHILAATMAGGWYGEILNRRKDGTDFPIELWTSIVRDNDGKAIATVGVARDITIRKAGEHERELLVSELQAALENVKTLDGLVPICAHCKKIRDDNGYWNQLEKYLGEHTDAKLTHGLCPDCANLYFPAVAAKTKPGAAL